MKTAVSLNMKTAVSLNMKTAVSRKIAKVGKQCPLHHHHHPPTGFLTKK